MFNSTLFSITNITINKRRKYIFLTDLDSNMKLKHDLEPVMVLNILKFTQKEQNTKTSHSFLCVRKVSSL